MTNKKVLNHWHQVARLCLLRHYRNNCFNLDLDDHDYLDITHLVTEMNEHTHTQTHRKNVHFYWFYGGTAVKMYIYTDLIGSYQ